MKPIIKDMVFRTNHGIVVSGTHRRLLPFFVVKNESITGGKAVCPSFFGATETITRGKKTSPGASGEVVFDGIMVQ